MFAMRWRRNVLSIVNSGRYRFFEGVDGASQRFVPIIADGRELQEVGRRGHYGPVVVFERNRIGKHQVNAAIPVAILRSSARKRRKVTKITYPGA